MKKILFVFGTRPEAIKMVPVIKQLQSERKKFDVRVCVTAQHRNLLDDVLKVFSVKPDYDLNIMTENQTLFRITTSVLKHLEPILKKEKPDLVLVHGDTTSTFAAALASYYLKIPLGHVEAGLRSYDKFNPFPEEINRHLTDALSDIYFCPTPTSKKALLKENVSPNNIFITGNTVIDALYMILEKKQNFKNPVLKQLFNSRFIIHDSKLILVTAHRRENFGKPMVDIFNAIKKISRDFPDCKIVYPVHPNPNVKIPAHRILGKLKNVYLVPPLDYSDLANLMKMSYLVLTDSGGLQEEAPSLGKPVLVMRRVTERPEAVVSGTVRLVGADEKRIFDEVKKLLTNKNEYNKMAKSTNPYGDGKAAIRTAESIKYFFGLSAKKPGEFNARTKKVR